MPAKVRQSSRQSEVDMSVDAVKKYLRKWDKQEDVLEFDSSSATVELAAQALGVEPERIAKTISLQYEDSAILIVTAGDAKIDNKKFKA